MPEKVGPPAGPRMCVVPLFFSPESRFPPGQMPQSTPLSLSHLGCNRGNNSHDAWLPHKPEKLIRPKDFTGKATTQELRKHLALSASRSGIAGTSVPIVVSH